MRGKLLDAIYERMRTDESIFFLTADMGINLVEKFRDAYPSRYLNVGIAEQDLIGISAGLCNLGYRPFAYTISNFLIHRCYEQIRNDVVLHDYPVTLVGTSTGFDNAPLGATHHIIDDWGALRTLPGIDIYCPSSVQYAESLLDTILTRGRPAYVRVGKGAPEKPASNDHAVYLKAQSNDILLVTYGGPVQNCLRVHEERDDVSVLVCNRLRPLEEQTLKDALGAHEHVLVVEDHFVSSGLFNMLCQFCQENDVPANLVSIGVPDEYRLTIGSSSAYYDKLYGLDVPGIERVIAQVTSRV